MNPSEASKKIEFHSKQICHGCVHPSMVGWCENHCQLPEAFNIAISVLEKQNPQIPKIKGILFYSYHMYGNCPCCKGQVEESWRFCPWCGQALNWGDDDD